MSFIDSMQLLDAQRLSRFAKATIQASGRLGFSNDATKLMGLSENKRMLVFSAGARDLGVVIGNPDDTRGFAIKKTGLYFYVRMKNYFEQAGVDYKKYRVVYDITELDEKYEEMTVFKLARRDLERGSAEEAEEEE